MPPEWEHTCPVVLGTDRAESFALLGDRSSASVSFARPTKRLHRTVMPGTLLGWVEKVVPAAAV